MKNLLKLILVTFAVMLVSVQAANAGNWSSRVMISDGGTTGWWYPQTAVDVNYIHVVWRDAAATFTQYRRSTDNGSTWNTIKTLVSSGGGSYNPHVAASGQYVHVVWKSNKIAYCRSTDYGATFANGVDLASHTSTWIPDVAAYESKVYVTWYDDTNGDIYLTRSTDNGANWSTPQDLTPTDTNTLDYIRVAAYNNNVYIAWERNTGGVVDVMFMRSTDSGVNWGAPVALWSNTGGTAHVSIAAYGSNVYVIRDDSTSGPLQRKSTDSGASFGSSTSIGNGNYHQAEVDATAAYTANGCNVYLRYSDNGIYVSTGSGTEQKIGTISPSPNSCKADIGANDSVDMHVVCNSRDGSGKQQIYYYHYPSAPTKIPTVSEWGLIVMAALLLAAGAVVIVKRKRLVAT